MYKEFDDHDDVGAMDWDIPLDEVIQRAEQLSRAKTPVVKESAIERMFDSAIRSFNGAAKNRNVEISDI